MIAEPTSEMARSPRPSRQGAARARGIPDHQAGEHKRAGNHEAGAGKAGSLQKRVDRQPGQQLATAIEGDDEMLRLDLASCSCTAALKATS